MANALKDGLVGHYPLQSNAVNMVDGVAGTINGTASWLKNQAGKVVLDDTTASVSHASLPINTVTYWKDGKFYAVLNGVPYMIDETLSSSFGVDADAIGAAIQYGIPNSPCALWMPAQDTSSLKDVSPNKNNASMSNCASGSGRALTFNGTNTYGLVSDSESVNIFWDANCIIPTPIKSPRTYPQGLANDGTYWYATGGAAATHISDDDWIVKFPIATPNTTTASNLHPLSHDADLTHLGECCIYNNKLYATAERGGTYPFTTSKQQIAVYSTSDLSLLETIDLSSLFVGVYSGWGVDGISISSTGIIYLGVYPPSISGETNVFFICNLSGEKTGEIALSEACNPNGLQLSTDETLLYTTKDNSSFGQSFRISDGQMIGYWTKSLNVNGDTHTQGLSLYNGSIYQIRRYPESHIRRFKLNDYIDGITIAAWVKPTRTNVYQGIVTRYNTTSNLRQYALAVNASNIFEFLIGKGSSAILSSANFGLVNNTWQLCVGTYDGMYLHVNRRTTAATSWTSRSAKASEFIGMTAYSQDVILGDNAARIIPFAGDIGIAVLWNRPLSSNEIETLFQNTKGYYL